MSRLANIIPSKLFFVSHTNLFLEFIIYLNLEQACLSYHLDYRIGVHSIAMRMTEKEEKEHNEVLVEYM